VQCLILAGGLATRLRPITTEIPKAMVSVARRPFADIQLQWLAAQGVRDVIYSIGYRGEQIADHVGDGSQFGLHVRYVDEGRELKGTGGALRLAYDQGALEPAFAMLYGDSYLSVPIADAWARFEALQPAALMTVWRNEGRFDTSNARLSGDWIVQYDKTVADPAAAGLHWIDYGFSIIDRDTVMPLIPAGEVCDFAAIQRTLSDEKRLAGYEVVDRFYEIGSPEGLAELEAHLSTGDAEDLA
jgi:MurNAc alpha-1-phosphate uridylyltransferase